MLCYVFTDFKVNEPKNFSSEEFEDIHNFFAALLSAEIGRQLKRGLYREYISRRENLPTLRGKIEMPCTIKNFTSGRRKIFCEYDELSENNLLNQILKATAILLLRHETVNEKYENILKKEILFFSSVDKILPDSICWEKVRPPRNNQSYRMMIGLCQFILEGMLLTSDNGEYKLRKFIDEEKISWLYEKFLLAYYKKNFPQLGARAAKISWALDDDEKNFLPTMRSDITLSSGDRVLIIDAKFYSETLQENFGAKKISSNNLYQIFTYVKNFSAHTSKKVSGMLLYARTDEKIQPHQTYRMSGNKISVKTLDLNKNFSDLERQLENIVEENLAS